MYLMKTLVKCIFSDEMQSTAVESFQIIPNNKSKSCELFIQKLLFYFRILCYSKLHFECIFISI